MNVVITPAIEKAVRTYLENNPLDGGRTVAREFDLTHSTATRLVKRIRQGKPSAPADLPAPGARKNETDDSVELVTSNPITLQDLLKTCKVDLEKYQVARWNCNKWEVGTKLDNGKVVRTPLFQIKAYLEPIPGVKESEVVRDTLRWITKNTPARRSVPAPKPSLEVTNPHLLEISVVDLHLGKLAWAPETGDNYDTEIAASLHQRAVEGLWNRAAVFGITKIVLIIGNDFFNVNSASNATAAGTPQSEDDRWPKTFRRGVAVLAAAIEFLRGKAPEGVEVRVIRGNHDSERIFSAGEVLAAMYAECGDVKIINNLIKRQYMRWGTVLLGWTHGDGAKLDKLPLLMAGEAAKQGAPWDGAEHREMHCGHFHHKKETQYHVGTECGPVRVRVLPSLTAADEYHYTNGYVGSLRAAEAYLWGQYSGYVGHLSWTPPEGTAECLSTAARAA